MADSFTVTLVSNQNGDRYAGNTNFAFSNALPRTMDLSNYQVALESMYFADDYPIPSATAISQPVEEKKFFNLAEHDNEITVVQVNASELRPRKRTQVFTEFLDSINTDAEFVNMPVNLIYTVTGPNVTQIALQYSPSPGYTLQIPSPLNKILGFKALEFADGTHVSDTKIDEDLFKTFAIGFLGSISEVSETRTQVQMLQIADKPDLENLLSLVSLTLANAKHTLTFTVDNKRGIVNYKVPNASKRILLSEFLNRYLERRDLFAFYGEGSFKVPRKIVYPSKVEPPPKTCSKILVMCDILQPQIFAGKEMPILAVIDRKHTTGASYISVEPRALLYKPIQVGKTDHISIAIQSDNTDFISLQETPSVINLHFRKA